MADAFPLQWPPHVKRTPIHKREWGSFQVTPNTATKNLLDEVRRSGGTNAVISTNRPARLDGLPRAGAREPEDSGVAVYFTRKGKTVCIPCDTYDKVWKNIRAIGLSIKDMRGPEARGCAQITDQAFTGFTALPSPDTAFEMPSRKSWFDVLDVKHNATIEVIEAAYKAKARTATETELYDLNAAKAAGLTAQKGGA